MWQQTREEFRQMMPVRIFRFLAGKSGHFCVYQHNHLMIVINQSQQGVRMRLDKHSFGKTRFRIDQNGAVHTG